MMAGVTCPKCGLMQLPGPTCKSCGAALGGPARRSPPPPAPVPKATGPSLKPPPQKTPQPSAQADPGTSRSPQLFFQGSGGSLFGIHILNLFLTVITLGIYYFWGKVKVRGYLLSQTEFEGDRFAYHGTGKELFLGTQKAALVFGVPVVFLNAAPKLLGAPPAIEAIAGFLTSGIFLVFLPFAMVGAQRYRLSRTSWREIRFSFRGSAWQFVRLFVGGSLLTAITLGLYYPIFATKRYGFMASHAYLGTQRFDFDGRGKDLFGRFLLAILLSIPTLGLYWFWFAAKKQCYLWEHTAFGKARFRSTVTGGRLVLLYLGNLLVQGGTGLLGAALGAAASYPFSLGRGGQMLQIVQVLAVGGVIGGIIGMLSAWPWIVVRNVRFALAYLTLEGSLDLAAIHQEAQAASATGEGLAGLLDAGLDLT